VSAARHEATPGRPKTRRVRHGYFFEELEPGMEARFAKTLTEADILLFGGVSGDTNPQHFDEDYASHTLFKGRIAHGILVASLISTVLGTKLPGPGAIYLSQSMAFRNPVHIGETVTALARIETIDREKRRVHMVTDCHVGERLCVEGEARVWVPSHGQHHD